MKRKFILMTKNVARLIELAQNRGSCSERVKKLKFEVRTFRIFRDDPLEVVFRTEDLDTIELLKEMFPPALRLTSYWNWIGTGFLSWNWISTGFLSEVIQNCTKLDLNYHANQDIKISIVCHTDEKDYIKLFEHSYGPVEFDVPDLNDNKIKEKFIKEFVNDIKQFKIMATI